MARGIEARDGAVGGGHGEHVLGDLAGGVDRRDGVLGGERAGVVVAARTDWTLVAVAAAGVAGELALASAALDGVVEDGLVALLAHHPYVAAAQVEGEVKRSEGAPHEEGDGVEAGFGIFVDGGNQRVPSSCADRLREREEGEEEEEEDG